MKKILSYKNEIVAGLGALATLMIFFPALVLRYTTQAYSGIQVAFGTDIANLGLFSNGVLQFNILIVLAYLLPIVGGLSLLFLRHGEKIASGLFLIAFVLLVTIPDRALIYIVTDGINVGFPVAWQFSYGLSIAVAFTLIGLVVTLYQTIVNVKAYRSSKKA
ncbi:MAG: hypothetical protein ACNA7K_04740 [Acholeplasmataceae bacterium]